MKRLMTNIVFALVDIACFLQGSIIIFYALLHFNYRTEFLSNSNYYFLENTNTSPIIVGGHYYYHDSYIKIAMIGLALVITGFLMRSWRKSF